MEDKQPVPKASDSEQQPTRDERGDSWGMGESGRTRAWSRLMAKRWQNLMNHPFEALKEEARLASIAKVRIVLSSVNSWLLILS